jgi:hypothetical protein
METRTKPESVPYIVFEGEMARQERHLRRVWIALLVAIVSLVLTVGTFVWYINQYDFASYEQDGEGVNILGTSNGGDCHVSATADTHQEEPLDGEG